jgi:hypothetical protein
VVEVGLLLGRQCLWLLANAQPLSRGGRRK